MKILKISIKEPDLEIINKAISIIKKGGILVYPTDTCYGLGIDPGNKDAVGKLIKLKGRTISKKISVIVSGFLMLKKICQVNQKQEAILKKYLPGPFTFILQVTTSKTRFCERNEQVLILTKKFSEETLGVRIPDCLVTQMLAQGLNSPYTTTSANFSGKKECYDISCVLEQSGTKKIQPDLILDAGKLPKNPPSTVVDLTCSPPRVLRKGSGDFSN